MYYKQLLKTGLKVGVVMATGAIIGGLTGKVFGEIAEHTPYINDVTQYIMSFFDIKADMGNLFSFYGFVYGPVRGLENLDKNRYRKRISERVGQLERNL